MSYTLFSIMPMFVSVFWVVILLIDRQNTNLSKRFLAFFLTLSILNYFNHALYFNHQYRLYVVFDSIWCFTSLSGYPLYYYYIRLLTQDTRMRLKCLWLIVPALSVALLAAVTYLLMSPADMEVFIHGVMYHKPDYAEPYSTLVRLQLFRLLLFKIVFAVQVVLVVYFGLKHIITYNRKIKDYYSNIGGKDLSPIKWLLIFFVFASVVSLTSSVIGKDFFISNPWLLGIPSITHSLYLFGIGYFGYKQNFTIQDFRHELSDSEEDAATETDSVYLCKNLDEKREELMRLIEQDEIYTNSDLRITDLAFMLNTNRTYASRLFNDVFNTNFADTINKYRIRKAKKLLHTNTDTEQELSLEDIFVMVGFASESTFYRSFKKETGMSPGEFRKALEKKLETAV